MARGLIRFVFWTLVLAATFVFGLGFGRTIAGDEKVARQQVDITQERGAITATLPTTTITEVKTVTVTKTVRVRARSAARQPVARNN